MTTRVLINGRVSDGTVSVTDSSVLRGDGCFEVLKSRSGGVFALDQHLDRLAGSAKIMDIELPPRSDIESWIKSVAEEGGDCVVRVVVTRGTAIPGWAPEPLVIVFGHPWGMVGGPTTLLPVVAPWHAAGAPWELAGAKILSYAPNLSATRRSVAEGFDDALLLTVSDVMLEGPTFSVAWVIGGVLETPGLGLGILDSITRRTVIDLAAGLGIQVREGEWTLDRLELADEVMALSTVREVQPVSAVGRKRFFEGPVTSGLARAFVQRAR
jgi:branched-subunit amino acid aminotransferase/4-amino-4-deoxychorismate lyase